MGLQRRARSNPLAWWWGLLALVSSANVGLWFLLYCQFHEHPAGTLGSPSGIEPMLLLCAAYVFGCAFRSFLPRADVQRICLVDSWLSSVLVGRSAATVAELCFAAQWALLLGEFARDAGDRLAAGVARAIVPIIAIAETSSWTAVLTTCFLWNALENSL